MHIVKVLSTLKVGKKAYIRQKFRSVCHSQREIKPLFQIEKGGIVDVTKRFHIPDSLAESDVAVSLVGPDGFEKRIFCNWKILRLCFQIFHAETPDKHN